jgi:hypothetical protein
MDINEVSANRSQVTVMDSSNGGIRLTGVIFGVNINTGDRKKTG